MCDPSRHGRNRRHLRAGGGCDHLPGHLVRGLHALQVGIAPGMLQPW